MLMHKYRKSKIKHFLYRFLDDKKKNNDKNSDDEKK